MAYKELLSWAAGRPLWQQDALRRLAVHGELVEQDLNELSILIESAQGLKAEMVPEAIPLAPEHLSETSSKAPKTVLASIGPVTNIDRLESDQPPIRFAVNGITLVYGPNASGKSGYCRIIKQLCRSLSPTGLRGNVFNSVQDQLAEVGIAFRVGVEGDPKTEMIWQVNDPPPSELARISVFDTASARVYVDKERKIEFLPFELDLLNKLGLAVRTLDNKYKVWGDTINAIIEPPLPTGYTEGTTVNLLLDKLVPETLSRDLPRENELCDLASWSDKDQAEFDSLVKQLNSDPETLLRLHTEALKALQDFKDDVSIIEKEIGDPAIRSLSQKQQDSVIKSKAAETSAHGLFKDEPIPDVGSDVWRKMLSYARDFATEVFPDHDPPQIATADRCVLCQQDLEETAAARLLAFDSYLGERASKEAEEANKATKDTISDVLKLVVKSKANVTTMLAGYAALSQLRKENGETIELFYEKAYDRLQLVQRILNEKSYGDLSDLNVLPISPKQLIDDEIVALEREIEEFTNLESDSEAAQRFTERHVEMVDRKKLSEEIDLVVERRNKLEERLRIAACRAECRLTAITQQITKRRRKILTPSLKKAFEKELKAFHLTHIPLDLTDRGDLGESIVEVALSTQQRVKNNSEVLSEGEQQGLAMACFLAELNEVGRDHGIIVDDPVSSLDHSRIQAVASRLSEEAAKGRQIIVFTHNIFFHYMLKTEARRNGVACHEEWMNSIGNDRFGIIDDAQKPWHIKPVTERLQIIDQIKQTLYASGYDRTDENFRDEVTILYTKMRTTWERVVEEILFNKVVQRFRPEVMTLSLRAACFDTENDYPLIFEGMKRTSHYSGHDLAEDLPPELPSKKEIDQDLGALIDFASSARARKKTLEKSMGPYADGVKAILL